MGNVYVNLGVAKYHRIGDVSVLTLFWIVERYRVADTVCWGRAGRKQSS